MRVQTLTHITISLVITFTGAICPGTFIDVLTDGIGWTITMVFARNITLKIMITRVSQNEIRKKVRHMFFSLCFVVSACIFKATSHDKSYSTGTCVTNVAYLNKISIVNWQSIFQKVIQWEQQKYKHQMLTLAYSSSHVETIVAFTRWIIFSATTTQTTAWTTKT